MTTTPTTAQTPREIADQIVADINYVDNNGVWPGTSYPREMPNWANEIAKTCAMPRPPVSFIIDSGLRRAISLYQCALSTERSGRRELAERVREACAEVPSNCCGACCDQIRAIDLSLLIGKEKDG